MTESDWLACTNPKAMLECVRPTASDRRYRLFAAACCRRVWHTLTDERSRQAIETIERFADGQASDEERETAQAIAAQVRNLGGILAKFAASISARHGAAMVIDPAGQAAAFFPDQKYDPSKLEFEWREQCGLIRDIFGNPNQPTTVQTSWRTSSVADLAQFIYDERDYGRMQDLGEALAKAGCTNVEMLNHCRSAGQHVRGCWVVDAILGKG